ncbi:MAG: HNH endonuclease family protein [Aeromicrobium sp.]
MATLTVKGRAPRTGYDRALFGQSWLDVDRNGCDTRNDILRRDLAQYVLKPDSNGCAVLTGLLQDPYTGRNIAFIRGWESSLAVQIDHVVALNDAWQKGAQTWTTEKRERFANDPLELLAVDGPANGSKSDGDAATWLPPNKPYRCEYIARQVAIKVKYGLSVTAAEGAAMARVLERCPDQKLPRPRPIVLG